MMHHALCITPAYESLASIAPLGMAPALSHLNSITALD